MNDLFLCVVQNSAVALVLALFVYGVTRVWRNPPVAHLLWLLVLLKLVAPPVLRVDWAALRLSESTLASRPIIAGAPRIDQQRSEIDPRFVDRFAAEATTQASVASGQKHDDTASIRLIWDRARPVLIGIWFGGAALCALVAARRIVRFERLLRGTLPASERLQRLAFEIARKFGIPRVPDVRYVECVEVPLLWCAGRRSTIVLPKQLLCQFDDQQVAMILAHELAHLRRRDHWVRAIEMVVAVAYWWNPLVWVIRRQIHQTEDLCCDAWVRCAFPDCAKRYAAVLLQTAESLSASQRGARLLPASPFLRSLSLKARIEMILESRFAPRISKKAMFVIAVLAVLVLPSFVQSTKTEARAGLNEEAAATPAGKPITPITSELPYPVRFEQGATRFLDNDEVRILEVRGTAETFSPGNIYWIKGTYKLASHDRAALSAFTTAMDAAHGTGPIWKVQTTVVNQGEGTFTLFLPMSCRGWPHVSFYPADGGSDFGGNYFGTGDSVLKRWWGSKETD